LRHATFILTVYARKSGRFYLTSNDSGVVLERNPDTVRGPDVAAWDDVERFEDVPKKWGDTQPRVAVEVLSPNDTASYITRKVTDYLDNNVDLVWVLDPKARTATVYRQDAGPKQLHEKDWLTVDDVLPRFRCKVAEFFVMPRPPRKKPRQKPRRQR
jgi:Uma2 family endonuclease